MIRIYAELSVITMVISVLEVILIMSTIVMMML
jgi:hypothetical protein